MSIRNAFSFKFYVPEHKTIGIYHSRTRSSCLLFVWRLIVVRLCPRTFSCACCKMDIPADPDIIFQFRAGRIGIAVCLLSVSFNQEKQLSQHLPPANVYCGPAGWPPACGWPQLIQERLRYQELLAFMVDKTGEQWFKNDYGGNQLTVSTVV